MPELPSGAVRPSAARPPNTTGGTPVAPAVALVAGWCGDWKRCGAGVAIYTSDDGELEAWEGLAFDRIVRTATTARLRAVLLALEVAGAAGIDLLEVRLDSPWIVDRLVRAEGERTGTRKAIDELIDDVRTAASDVKSIVFIHKPTGHLLPAQELAIDAIERRTLTAPMPRLASVHVRAGQVTAVEQMTLAEKVERTCELATDLRLCGADDEIGATLLAVAPDDLRQIWGRLPRDTWLTRYVGGTWSRMLSDQVAPMPT